MKCGLCAISHTTRIETVLYRLREANERTDASPVCENRNELLRSIVSDRFELERIQDKILIFPQAQKLSYCHTER